MKIRRWFIIVSLGIVLILGVVSGCFERERNNPFDPAGGQDGTVFHLEISANLTTVILDWNPVDSPDLSGYNIYRGSSTETFQLHTQVSDTVSRYIDRNLQAEKDFAYAISARGEEDETILSPVDTIIPGNSWWWYATDSYTTLYQVSHDGLHLYKGTAYYYAPEHVAAPANNDEIYVYDRFGGQIFRQEPSQQPVLIAAQKGFLTDLLYNGTEQSLVLVKDTSVVEIIDLPQGGSRYVNVPGTVSAAEIYGDGKLWIGAGETLYALNSGSSEPHEVVTPGTGGRITDIEITGPRSVYLIQENRDEILRVDNGIPVDTISLDILPLQIEYNSSRAELWIRGWDSTNSTFAVYRSDGNVTELMVNNLIKTYDISVNPVSGDCMVPEYESGTLYRIDEAGKIRKKEAFLQYVHEIVVQPMTSL